MYKVLIGYNYNRNTSKYIAVLLFIILLIVAFFWAEKSFSSIGFFHTLDQLMIGNDSTEVFYLKVFSSGCIAYVFNYIHKIIKANFLVNILILMMIQCNFLYFFLLIIIFLLY